MGYVLDHLSDNQHTPDGFRYPDCGYTEFGEVVVYPPVGEPYVLGAKCHGLEIRAVHETVGE